MFKKLGSKDPKVKKEMADKLKEVKDLELDKKLGKYFGVDVEDEESMKNRLAERQYYKDKKAKENLERSKALRSKERLDSRNKNRDKMFEGIDSDQNQDRMMDKSDEYSDNAIKNLQDNLNKVVSDRLGA